MTLIYETNNFILESFETPHVTRTDGGHLKLYSKKHYENRWDLPPNIAIECMRLTMIIGKAFKQAMKNSGIELVRVNFQDMGNWAFKTGKQPFFHIHIYGRAKNAKWQPYTEAVSLPDRSSGFYDDFEPLNNGDIEEIKHQISKVIAEDKYQERNWWC
jgi:diadenosine tetraphosphate (Ap4A) HIT family hydrolase